MKCAVNWESPMQSERRLFLRCGFTLIEMLVVMALIAIFTAILFPVFTQVREKARQRVCGSNLQQIGTAAALYRQDYDGRFPLAVTVASRRFPDVWAASPFYADIQTLPLLPDILQTYCHSREIFRCPSDAGLPATVQNPAVYPSVYAVNSMSYYFYGESFALYDLPEYLVINPSEEPYLTDTADPWHTSYAFGSDYFSLKGNALYLDGHVKFVFARLQSQ